MSPTNTSPKAIILAAGQGQRLRPMTDDRPKGMISVHGRTIIERQLQLFRKVGVDRVSIVKGYCASSVPDYGAIHYVNEAYAETNMVCSLFAAADELVSGPVIVSYGDILYSESVLQTVINSAAPVAVAVDRDWMSYYSRRFDDPFDDAESLVLDSDGAISSIGKGNPSPDEVQAQYIGLTKFQGSGLTAANGLQEAFATTETTLGWGRPWRKAYMTDLLQELINRGSDVRAVPISGGWCEIDSPRDYELALEIAEEIEG